jgi:hypothetical protein
MGYRGAENRGTGGEICAAAIRLPLPLEDGIKLVYQAYLRESK